MAVAVLGFVVCRALLHSRAGYFWQAIREDERAAQSAVDGAGFPPRTDDLALFDELFGDLLRGTAEHPAVTKESVHHISKLVSGAPIKRPAWFFDVAQQGDGP